MISEMILSAACSVHVDGATRPIDDDSEMVEIEPRRELTELATEISDISVR